MGFKARDLFVGGLAFCGTTPKGLRCWGLDESEVLAGSVIDDPYSRAPKPAAVALAPEATGVEWKWVLDGGAVRRLPYDPGSPLKTVLDGVAALSANRDTACAVLAADHTVRCWGSGIYGLLGAGPRPTNAYGTVRSDEPIAALDLRGVEALRVSDSHACALAEGAVWCWGANALGQLGLGDTADRDRPVKVGGLPPVRQLELGSSHTCAIDTSDALWCWGSDLEGQVRGSDTRCRPEWLGETEQVPCQTTPRRVEGPAAR